MKGEDEDMDEVEDLKEEDELLRKRFLFGLLLLLPIMDPFFFLIITLLLPLSPPCPLPSPSPPPSPIPSLPLPPSLVSFKLTNLSSLLIS